MKHKLLNLILICLISFSFLNAQERGKPLKIADEFVLNLTSTNNYYNNSNRGIVYSKTFSNKGSAYIKLHLNSFDLKPGDYVIVYGTNGEEYIYSEKGKIVGLEKKMISEFWTGTIWSDSITIELHSKGSNKNHFGFNIDKVAYGHSQDKINAAIQKLDTQYPQESICSADNKEPIVCYDGTEMGRKAEAVCRLLIGGGGLCTGWLLGCDGSVMTNNHCIGSATDANNTDFLFNYQYDNCAETVDATSDLQATSAAFVMTDSNLDFTLVTLPVNPTATYGYLSLSSVPVTNGERIYIPQHPGGRRKEIAVNTDIGGDANGFAMITNAGTGATGSRVEYQCDTEGGSSGSPVLRYNDNLVVAIHNTGGCPNGSYGRSDQIIASIGSNMPSCGVDDENPAAPFVSALNSNINISEASDCSFQDITLNIKIAQAASANADVSLNVIGGTATNLVDFELLNSNVTFPAGDDTNKFVTLRVFNDNVLEGDENIMIQLNLNPNGGDAQLASIDTFNVTINDNDYNPNIGSQLSFYNNNFNSGLGDFTITNNGPSDFQVANPFYIGSQYFDTSGADGFYVYVNDDECNCDMSEERITITNPFDFSSVTEAFISFDYTYVDQGGQYNNDAYVQVSTDNGANWVNVTPDLEQAEWANLTVDLTAYAGLDNVLISFFYTDNGNWAFGLALDNINVFGNGNSAVQTTVNTTTPTNLNINGFGTSYVFDETSANVMLSVTENDNLDYGCTTVEVSREGTSAQSYNGSVAPELVTDKTFTITPSITNPSASATLSFYFTEAEIAGWETATGDSRSNLRILKDNGSGTEDVSTTITAFGSDLIVTGTLSSGINGTYYFGNNAFLSVPNFNYNNNFGIYPNPVSNILHISSANGSLPESINVHNMLGQTIYTKPISSKSDLSINTSSFSNGMYFITISSKTASQTLKFLKK